MADTFFVLKSLIVTFIVIVLMQIKVSGLPVETHIHRWIKKSEVVAHLRGVAHGAVGLIDKGYDAAVQLVESKPTKSYSREQRASAGNLELNFDRRNFRWNDSEATEKNEKEESSQTDDSDL